MMRKGMVVGIILMVLILGVYSCSRDDRAGQRNQAGDARPLDADVTGQATHEWHL